MAFKTSIAMATYNGEDYLKEQLDSFLRQTSWPDELVVSDDGSTDSTISIVSEYAAEKFEFVLHQNPKQVGYAQNFSKALTLAYGDIVFLSDQDDVWLDVKVAKITEVFEQEPDKYLIIHDLAYCDQNLKPVGQTKLERLGSITTKHRSYVTGMATAVRKELLDICLPIPNNPLITHDLWLHECANALGVKKVIPDVLALYRRHSSNATKDEILNSVKKTSAKDFVLSASLQKTKLSLQRKVATLTELTLWLQNNRPYFSIFGLSRSAVDFADAKASAELVFCKKRFALLCDPWAWRLCKAVLLYVQGGYQPFLGLRSMLKDIFAK